MCRKCRASECPPGDNWCILCSCAQSLSEVAKHRFFTSAHRSLAEEIGLQAVRQVRSLVTIDRQVQGEQVSLTDRLNNEKRKVQDLNEEFRGLSAQPKSANRRPEPPARASGSVKVERSDREESLGADYAESEEYGEESEEEATHPRGSETNPGDRAPVSPIDPPKSKPKSSDRQRSRSRNRGRRGGAKHQQVHRGLREPHLEFHRKQRTEPIELKGSRPGAPHKKK